MKDASSHSGSSVILLIRFIVLIIAIAVGTITYTALVDTTWAKEFRQDPQATAHEGVAKAERFAKDIVQQASPLPRDITICDKSDAGGQRVILTSDGEQFVIGDEVAHGLLFTGETLTGAEAYDMLERGRAYQLGVRSIPVLDWNTTVNFVGKPFEPPVPDKCPQ